MSKLASKENIHKQDNTLLHKPSYSITLQYIGENDWNLDTWDDMTICAQIKMGEQDINPRKHYYINPPRDWLKYIKQKNFGVAV